MLLDDSDDDDMYEQQMLEIDNGKPVMVRNVNKVETPQGYKSDDLSKMSEGKQTRVLLYLGLALVPVLFLIPFFMSRSFVPSIDPGSMVP